MQGISIGLNIQQKYMGTIQELELTTLTNGWLKAHGATVYTSSARGTGEWDGRIEYSLTWIFDDVDQTELEKFGSELCRRYRQEAVAIMAGQTTLITGAN